MDSARKGWITRRRNQRRKVKRIEQIKRHVRRCKHGCYESKPWLAVLKPKCDDRLLRRMPL